MKTHRQGQWNLRMVPVSVQGFTCLNFSFICKIKTTAKFDIVWTLPVFRKISTILWSSKSFIFTYIPGTFRPQKKNWRDRSLGRTMDNLYINNLLLLNYLCYSVLLSIYSFKNEKFITSPKKSTFYMKVPLSFSHRIYTGFVFIVVFSVFVT